MTYHISVYVPASHLDTVKNALFAAGAGTLGNYSHCAWQTLGQGQFLPLPGSNPAIGQEQILETVKEYKVEFICEEKHLQDAIHALIESHPYETPAYYVIPLAKVFSA